MRKAIMGATMLLVGCGPAGGFYYRAGCVEMSSPEPMVQHSLDWHVEVAQRVIDDHFGKGAFCNAVRNDIVEIRLEPWKCTAYPNTKCAGEETLGHIKIDFENPLVHEVIHKIQGDNLEFDTMWHAGWDVKGYQAMDADFKHNGPWLVIDR